MIGEAYVVISPDTDGFRPLVETEVRAAVAGIKPTVPVGLNVDRNALGQFLSAAQRAANLKVNVETAQAVTSITDLRTRMEDLSHAVSQIEIGADDTKALATMAGLQGKIAALASKLTNLQLNADDTKVVAKIAALQAQIAHLSESIGHIEADVDIAAAQARLAQLTAELELLQAKAATIRLGISAEGLAAVEATMLSLEAASDDLKESLTEDTAAMATFTRGVGPWSVSLLTGEAALFGGAAAAKGWHIALDGIVEVLAVAIPAVTTAALGLGIFGLAAAKSADQIYLMDKAIVTVSTATNSVIAPMTGNFQKLENAVRPQVWELYGEAIQAAGNQSGVFNKLALETGSYLDTLGARIVNATKSGGAFTTFLAAGAKDMQTFGQIGDTLGDVFAKLIKVTEETHIAEDLLDIVAAATKLLDVVLSLPTPVLAVAAAIHGIYLWGGLATTGLINVVAAMSRMVGAASGLKLADTALGDLSKNGSGLDKLSSSATILGASVKNLPERFASLGESIAGLAANPWTWAVVGVAALTALVIWTLNAKDATDKWIASSQKIVDSADLYTAVNVTASQLVTTTEKLTDVNAKFADGVTRIGPELAQNAHDIQALNTYHDQLTQTLGTEVDRISGVAKQYGTTLPGAMALATFAGVKVSDLMSTQNSVWATAVTKIAGVVEGYKAMGQGSGQLGNDISAVNVASSNQAKAITNLNSAWDSFTKTVTAPVDTFLSFSQTLVRFGADADVAGAKMTGLGSGIQDVSKKVTNSSVQLQQDFQSALEAGEQLFDAMRSSQAPADQQIKAIKDTVASLIPLAGTSKTAAAEISALSQEAGGPATTNLQTLKKWAGETGTQGMQGLQKDTDNAAISMSNLSDDAKKLSDSLQSDLNSEMSKAIENAVGLQGAMDKYTKSLHDNGAATTATETDRQQLSGDLNAVFHNGTQATDVINTLSGAFTNNGNAANDAKKFRQQLITDFTNQTTGAKNANTALDNYTNEVKTNGSTTDAAKKFRQQLITDLTNAGVQSKTANGLVTTYTNGIKSNGTITDAAKNARQQMITDILNAGKNATSGKALLAAYTTEVQNNGSKTGAAQSERAQLIKDLTNAGVSSKTAQGLVDGLTKSITDIPSSKNVTITMKGNGTYSIQQSRTITSTGQVNTLGGHTVAAGGMIHSGTGPTADDVPAWLSRGEVVVPTHMVNAGAVDHLRGKLPGFAAGGLVTSGNLITTTPATDYTNFQNTMTASMVSAMKGSLQAAAAAAAAASAGSNAYAGPGSSNYSADISAVLKTLGLPASLLSNWLRQITTESGGSLTAVNESDSNAQAGHPSVGLLQIIPGTFAAYAGPYRNTPPLVNYGGGTVSENAMAQIYAAINYANSRYGAGMASVIGQGHGYGLGGRVFDRGGTLKPGWNPPMYNATGRDEQLANVTGFGSRAHPTSPGHAAPHTPAEAEMIGLLRQLVSVTGQQGTQFGNVIQNAASGAAMRGRYSTRHG